MLPKIIKKIFSPVTISNYYCAINRLASSNCRRFEGKVAIVTGSTDGIGLAIARRLGEEGAKVVVSSRKQENVDNALRKLQNEGLETAGIVCHAGKAEDREALINKALEFGGGLDVVVSNAAVNPFEGPAINTPGDAWDEVMDVDLKSSFQLSQQVYPHLTKRGGGSIVFVSSGAGYAPKSRYGAYSVAKTALFGATKLLATELGPHNIRVNCIAPGMVDTKMFSKFWNVPAADFERIASQLVIKRIGKPEDMGGAVAFLCSTDADYITGEVICITGGYSLRL